jgi:hypothetical protein
MAWPRGVKRPKTECRCTGEGCAAILIRPLYNVKHAKCHTCKRKQTHDRWNATIKRLRVQSRRYRVLMFLLRWQEEHFEANVALLRQRLADNDKMGRAS